MRLIITGTRKGIGRELAQCYLQQGHQVFGCSRGSASIDAQNYRHFQLDVADEAAVVQMIKNIKAEKGAIDVLINNAGIAAMNHLLTTPLSRAHEVFNTNFFGTFLFSREVAKQMIRQKKGVIINYTTVAVALDLEGEAVYAASKAAIESFTRISARELAAFGIRVNAIGPTPVKTDLIAQIPQQKLEQLLQRQMIPHFADVKDIKQVIDFFIHTPMITGQTLYLGGVV